MFFCLFFVLISLVNVFAIDPTCDFYQDMVLGQTYFIYNKGYPNYYTGAQSCRYLAYSPVGTRIVVTCDIDIPNTQGCTADKLAISLTGNADFQDAKTYCGRGSVSFVSDSNSLSIGLGANANTNGGRFLCNITATQGTTPSPTECDCGRRKMTRIVGGANAGVNEFPLMAGLVDVSQQRVYCGGSIISNRYVLTAAHCVFGKTTSQMVVLVGDHDVSTGTDTSASKLVQIQQFIINTAYNKNTQENDIALVKTATVIEFNANVGPVCLPFNYQSNSFENYDVTVLGWGQLEYSGPQSDILQKVNLKIVNLNSCYTALQGSGVVTVNNICTYGVNKDACLSDSGGPVLWYNTQTMRLQLIGVLSYGIACATQLPGVSTRVTSYLNWIVANTPDAQYCLK